MSKISEELATKIEEFAAHEARKYVEEAERDYEAVLGNKSWFTKRMAERQKREGKSHAENITATTNDLIMFISDFIDEKMHDGHSEEEAFRLAKEEFAFIRTPSKKDEIKEQVINVVSKIDFGFITVILLTYLFSLLIGSLSGTLIGFAIGGGLEHFTTTGYIPTLIGLVVGSIVGLLVAIFTHLMLAVKRSKK